MKTLLKLTKQEKIEILEEAKRRIQENSDFICTLIGDIIFEKHSRTKSCLQVQKKFGMNINEAKNNFNAKSEKLPYSAWWDYDNQKDRIKYIDHLISKLK